MGGETNAFHNNISLSCFKGYVSGGGYVTDEELDLCQTIEEKEKEKEEEATPASSKMANNNRNNRNSDGHNNNNSNNRGNSSSRDEIQSPSKEVLIADNGSRRYG